MSRSPELFARALAVTPGGVHSPVRAFKSVGGRPIFFQRGAGAHLVDVDGRRYIDFCGAFGPLILGHADPDVARAVHAAIDDGWSYGACEPYSLALAEWIVERVPWVERIRFVSSGTEAVISALRVARGATGRAKILKFDGCYHGHGDSMLIAAGSGLAGRVASSSSGIPPSTINDVLVAPLDDDAAIDQAFDRHGADIAAVIVEPVPANFGLLPQRIEWLRHLQARARAAGSLLILDEVITGFRSSLRGAAGTLDIQPDLVTYGKVIGGGFPVGAYAGRAELLDLVAPSGPVYQAGTLSANPVAMRGGLATLEKIERAGVFAVLEERTARFVESLAPAFAKAGVEIVRHGSIFWFHRLGRADAGWHPRTPTAIPPDQPLWFARFFHAALEQGVYLPPSTYEVGFVSFAHDARVLDEATRALTRAIDISARA